MSLFAGIYARWEGAALDPAATGAMTKSISRRGDPIETFQDERFFLAKFDFGAFDSPAFLIGEHVAAATGEPFLNPGPGRASSRAEDLVGISNALVSTGLGALRGCQGSFSVCQYLPSRDSLLLATDRAGVRPVYYYCGPDFIFFSSNLRVLENVVAIPKRMDLRGVTEKAVFNYTLGSRTPYADIKTLLGGEVLECRAGEVRLSRYFRWCDIHPTKLRRDQMLDVAHETFMQALECRSERDEVVTSFLSGGMDSRVVVAGLRALGKEVYTLTFESSGPKDPVIARLVAKSLGTHHTTELVDSQMRQPFLKASAAGRIDYPPEQTPRFPSLVFSGDGGSVGLGCVYMDDHLVQLCRDGSTDELLKYIGAYKGLPRRLFYDDVFEQIQEVVARGVQEEMSRGKTGDPAKDYYLYLMDNDQRKHLWYVYEDIDQNRTETLLPFLDGRFLELIVSAPIDWLLLHRFYNDWMFKFPESATAVPWQTYPGHVPCPITDEETDSYRSQWRPTRQERFARARPAFRESVRACLGTGHPKGLIRRWPVALAALVHGLKISDRGYLWNVYNTFGEFSRACPDGVAEWSLSESDSQ
jgi:hypothetical protein